jgi:hypothetical protein
MDLAVEVEEVEAEDADRDFNVLYCNRLAGAGGERLKGEDLLLLRVVRHDLAVENSALHPRLGNLRTHHGGESQKRKWRENLRLAPK